MLHDVIQNILEQVPNDLRDEKTGCSRGGKGVINAYCTVAIKYIKGQNNPPTYVVLSLGDVNRSFKLDNGGVSKHFWNAVRERTDTMLASAKVVWARQDVIRENAHKVVSLAKIVSPISKYQLEHLKSGITDSVRVQSADGTVTLTICIDRYGNPIVKQLTVYRRYIEDPAALSKVLSLLGRTDNTNTAPKTRARQVTLTEWLAKDS